MPKDEIDAAIELAGLISSRLHEWSKRSQIGKSGGKKSSDNLTPEQRSERAKKAVQARIAKYGQKTRISFGFLNSGSQKTFFILLNTLFNKIAGMDTKGR